MSAPIISVQSLGKRYRIAHQQGARYAALRDVIASGSKGAAGWIRDRLTGRATRRTATEWFWALRDVGFEVRSGEVLGIIGSNGAGKSTLLRILSRITEPTEGRVMLDGRVACLLEVGTGFHPELTGRENIFLNGAILGLRRTEILKRFDEIVAFAGVERFVDTPVKRYSSGMYMRLAFAVAAHLDAEILIVDEVLAVGDAQFQRKCLGRMSEVANSGRTVLLVSHNMNAVENFCSRAILLEGGRLAEQSEDVRAVINRYLAGGGAGTEASAWVNPGSAFDHPAMQPRYFAVVDRSGQVLAAPVRNDEPLTVVIRADVRQADPALNAGFALYNEEGDLLLWSMTTDGPEHAWPQLRPGEIEFRCALPARWLNEGRYRLELNCSLHHRDWFVRPGYNSPAVHFEIRGGLSDSPYWVYARPGILAPEWSWESSR